MGQIYQQANLSASQFIGEPICRKINNFDLSSLALKGQQKNSCYVTKTIKKTIAIVQLLRVKIHI